MITLLKTTLKFFLGLPKLKQWGMDISILSGRQMVIDQCSILIYYMDGWMNDVDLNDSGCPTKKDRNVRVITVAFIFVKQHHWVYLVQYRFVNKNGFYRK